MGKKKLIVIADHNKAHRLLIRETMEKLELNADILECANAENLVAVANGKYQPPDFVILDTEIQLNGLEVLRYLRKNANVPVIVFTSCYDKQQEQKALALGALKYIGKEDSLEQYKDLVLFIKDMCHPR